MLRLKRVFLMFAIVPALSIIACGTAENEPPTEPIETQTPGEASHQEAVGWSGPVGCHVVPTYTNGQLSGFVYDGRCLFFGNGLCNAAGDPNTIEQCPPGMSVPRGEVAQRCMTSNSLYDPFRPCSF
jgi:hypothetical protein